MITLGTPYIVYSVSLNDSNVYSIISAILIKARQRQGVQLRDRTSASMFSTLVTILNTAKQKFCSRDTWKNVCNEYWPTIYKRNMKNGFSLSNINFLWFLQFPAVFLRKWATTCAYNCWMISCSQNTSWQSIRKLL